MSLPMLLTSYTNGLIKRYSRRYLYISSSINKSRGHDDKEQQQQHVNQHDDVEDGKTTTKDHTMEKLDTELLDHLATRIKLMGPLSVADYMKECLTNPRAGYYMRGDVFGKDGDFITAPEISQIFGELIATWMFAQWERCGRPSPVNIIELGPGRGTLAKDAMRTLASFSAFDGVPRLRLVERSPAMVSMQRTKLCGDNQVGEEGSTLSDVFGIENGGICQDGNAPVSWHQNLSDVPSGFSFIMANEFFDALPVHQFEFDGQMWRERLIDISTDADGHRHLRFVLSKNITMAATALPRVLPPDALDSSSKKGDRLEVSPASWNEAQELSRRLATDGGCALLVDYGHDITLPPCTLRAIRKHKILDIFETPGHCDLTADVSFAGLRAAISTTGADDCSIQQTNKDDSPKRGVQVYGPLTQGIFLQSMGIMERLIILLKRVKGTQHANDLIDSSERLMDPHQMGSLYKVLCVSSDDIPPPLIFAPTDDVDKISIDEIHRHKN